VTAAGAVIRAADVRADRAVAGASMRTLFDCGPAGTRLGRRLVEVASGSVLAGTAGNSGELWFVIAGYGRLELAGHRGLGLHADQGLWLPPGAEYRVHAEGQGELRLDVVTLPAASAGQQSEPLSRNLDDCAVETTGDRRFRVLFGPGLGCRVATQFVGEIPPGRAPDHSHPYDEVVLVLEGEGIVHIGGAGHAIAPGACVHLPPGLPHCLENTGSTTMRVLGVFHPADSPAAKLGPAG
jgi:mannose-6-phosphate isomerase-like protein (cupin superfamily)